MVTRCSVLLIFNSIFIKYFILFNNVQTLLLLLLLLLHVIRILIKRKFQSYTVGYTDDVTMT